MRSVFISFGVFAETGHHESCFCRPCHGCNLLHGRVAQPLHAFEFGEQGCGGCRSNAFYGVELAAYGVAASAVAVVGYAEAVGFVAQVLHHAQCLGVLIDVERHGVAGEVDFLQSLGDADHGDSAT